MAQNVIRLALALGVSAGACTLGEHANIADNWGFQAQTAALAAPGTSKDADKDTNIGAVPSASLATSSICRKGTHRAGAAKYAICMPSGAWNRRLVVYAHGYTAPSDVTPPALPLAGPDGVSIPDGFTARGYAFAASSFSDDGLAVLEGLADSTDLVKVFRRELRQDPETTYVVGVSEGGLIAALAMEERDDEDDPAGVENTVFDGGLALCGPIGSFRRQLDYFGDVRALFDYFFPHVLPGGPDRMPAQALQQWDPRLLGPVLFNDFNSTWQLLKVAGVPIDPRYPVFSAISAVSGVLWYNVFGIEDAKQKLGGAPYENLERVYSGSANDFLLNAGIVRYESDADDLSRYETTGQLSGPLVTLHNTSDPIVPAWHEQAYGLKHADACEEPGECGVLLQRHSTTYGHCRFSQQEVADAFDSLVLAVEGKSRSRPRHAHRP